VFSSLEALNKGVFMKHLFLICVMLILASCSKSKDNDSGGVDRYVDPLTDRSGAVEEMVYLLNDHRARLNLPKLSYNEALTLEAQIHTDDMAFGRRRFGHDGMSQRCLNARRALGRGNACGEIVSRFHQNADQAFNGWMNSWSHRTQIEDYRYTHIGVGLAIDGRGLPYWTVLFLQR